MNQRSPLTLRRLALFILGVPLAFAGSVRAEEPRINVKPVGPDYYPPSYHGTIVGITDKAVTIKLVGTLRITEVVTLPGGSKQRKVYVQDNTQPPREFVFLEKFFKGPDGQLGVSEGHKIADLRMGDVIYINCVRVHGVDYCSVVEIQRRYGGRVPPAIQDEWLAELGRKLGKDFTESYLHTRMNAEQEREQKVILVLGLLGQRLLQ